MSCLRFSSRGEKWEKKTNVVLGVNITELERWKMTLHVMFPKKEKQQNKQIGVGGGGRGGEFLKQLWCCVDGKYNKIIWFHQLG